jgi:hypothetical protein
MSKQSSMDKPLRLSRTDIECQRGDTSALQLVFRNSQQTWNEDKSARENAFMEFVGFYVRLDDRSSRIVVSSKPRVFTLV